MATRRQVQMPAWAPGVRHCRTARLAGTNWAIAAGRWTMKRCSALFESVGKTGSLTRTHATHANRYIQIQDEKERNDQATFGEIACLASHPGRTGSHYMVP
jgi:hypothetical protein